MEKNETYYQNLDKRTKEYREWKKKRQAQAEGLGDSVQRFTKATGIEKAVKFIAGEDCGCEERKAALNKVFRYNNPLCLREDEYLFLSEFFSERRSQVTMTEQKRLFEIYNRVFRAKQKLTKCSSCVASVVNNLRTYYNKYNE